MASGPHHYQVAEELLAQAIDRANIPAMGVQAQLVATAQVHATLALAAAAAWPAVVAWTGDESADGHGWSGVTA